jgi:hypothetical protein
MLHLYGDLAGRVETADKFSVRFQSRSFATLRMIEHFEAAGYVRSRPVVSGISKALRAANA